MANNMTNLHMMWVWGIKDYQTVRFYLLYIISNIYRLYSVLILVLCTIEIEVYTHIAGSQTWSTFRYQHLKLMCGRPCFNSQWWDRRGLSLVGLGLNKLQNDRKFGHFQQLLEWMSVPNILVSMKFDEKENGYRTDFSSKLSAFTSRTALSWNRFGNWAFKYV